MRFIGYRVFIAFALFSATSAFAFETQVSATGDLFSAMLKSRIGESGDAQRLHDALPKSEPEDYRELRLWRGKSVTLSCQKDAFRCRGCLFYDCSAVVKPTEDSFVDGKSIETFLAGEEARGLFDALALPVTESSREGMKILEKSFVTSDQRLSLACDRALEPSGGASHRCRISLNGN